MTAIRIVSLIHGLWGITIMLLPLAGQRMPRPFGSLEAYFSWLSETLTGAMFLSCALLCLAALHCAARRPRLTVLGVLPQQAILLWGAYWGALIFLESAVRGSWDARTLISSEYIIVLACFHGFGVRTLWALARVSHGRS
jgi:hypothetical protein